MMWWQWLIVLLMVKIAVGAFIWCWRVMRASAGLLCAICPGCLVNLVSNPGASWQSGRMFEPEVQDTITFCCSCGRDSVWTFTDPTRLALIASTRRSA